MWTCYEWTKLVEVMRGVRVIMSASSLPPILEWGFKSRLGLEFSDFSVWHFLKLVVRGFLWVLRFPPLLHWLMVSVNKVVLK